MKPSYTITLMAVALCATVATAQQPLSIDDCRAMALKYNKEITAAAKQTESAEYTARSYKSNFLPNITASATGIYSTADGKFDIEGGNLPVLAPNPATGALAPNGTYAYFPGLGLEYSVGPVVVAGVSVEQPIYMGGKINAAYKMATIGHQMSAVNEKITAAAVIVQVDQAYALVVKAQEMQKVARSYNALLLELKSNVESAYRHGVKPHNDVLKVEVKLNESELSIRKADNALRLAKMNLCHIIGKPLTDSIAITSEYPTAANAAAHSTDISARPEYSALSKQMEIEDQRVKIVRSEQLPQVGIRGSYNYIHGIEVNDQTLFSDGALTVLLNVNIPLFHFGEKSNKVKAARAQREQTMLKRENLNEQMTLELTQAINNLDEAELECQLAQKALEQADENMRMSKRQYEAGTEPLSDYLEAQALWQKAYQTNVDAQFQRYICEVSYRKASGSLIADNN